MANWRTLGRPGYFGSKRDEKHREYDAAHGIGNWRIAWQAGETTVGYLGACALYEDAYFAFLAADPQVLDRLCREAEEVYDTETTNVESGLDYLKQEGARTHIQDISIRRCLVRLGRWFRGTELIRIRDRDGAHPLSMTLSPGQVPFHRPELILTPELAGWWKPGSVESFYQSNKILQVRT